MRAILAVLDLLIYKAIQNQQQVRQNREYLIVYDPADRIETALRHRPILLKYLHLTHDLLTHITRGGRQ